MKTALFLLLISCSCFATFLVAFSQIIPQQEWVQTFNGSNNLNDGAFVIGVDGSIVVSGITETNPGTFKILTVKYNKNGAQLWAVVHNTPGTFIESDFTNDIKLDNAGNVYIATSVAIGTLGTDKEFTTIKYDSLGALQWVATHADTGEAYSLVLDGTGNVFVTGWTKSGTLAKEDFTTVKYNSNGVQQWTVKYGGTERDIANSIALDGSGNLYITGVNLNTTTNRANHTTIKYNNSGVQQWAATFTNGSFAFTGNEQRSVVAASNIVLSNGDVFITGAADNGGVADYVTIKYNNSGVQQWIKTFNGNGNGKDYISDIDILSTGEIVITGGSFGASSSDDYVNIQYEPISGSQNWLQSFNGNANGTDKARGLVIDNTNNIYVTGVSFNGTNNDFATVKYSSGGIEQWDIEFNGVANGNNEANDIGVDVTGNVYVVGLSFNGSNFDYATVKYSQVEPITITVSVIDENCEAAGEGSIDLTVTGGIMPYTFLWSTGETTEDISGLTAGNYVVIVKDNISNAVIDTAVISNPSPDPNDPPSCSEVFISEYCDGSFHNKAIELYNSSDDTIILNRYFLRVFMNGAPTPLIQQLLGVLLPKQTFVIAHPNANAAILSVTDQTTNKLNFNGDEPVQLVKVLNDITIDIDSIEGHGGNPHAIFDTLDLDTLDNVGIPGVWPGNQGYPVGSGTTKNSTLIRKAEVTTGKEDWACGQKQWRVNGVDDVSNLKQHQSTCGIVEPIIELVFSGNGTPIFAAKELIVRFDTSAVKRSAVDNMPIAESIQRVDLSYFIKPFAVSAINQKVIGLCDTSAGSIKALKIFRQLKTTDTATVSRLGETIPIPPFWATFVVEFPVGTEIGKVADSLNTLFPLIKYTHPNFIGTLTSSADDTEYPNQSSLHPTTSYDTAHINVEPAWDFETGKPFIRVGVFDTGIDWDHEDFGDGTISGSKVIDGWDFNNNTPLKSTTASDLNGHGTSCAGIIGGIRNNNLGIAGIAGGNDIDLTDLSDKGVSLYGLRIFAGLFFGNPINYVADAIITSSIEDTTKDYGYGLHVMSNSWRFAENFTNYFTDTNITLLTEAVHFANRAKVTFVAARGNEGYANQAYPAIIDDDWVLCIGGTGTDGEYIHISSPNPNGGFNASQGWEIDVSAPAEDTIVRTVQTGGGYKNFNGTSAATPHVAGVVGLLMSYLNTPSPSYNNLAPEDAEAIVQMTAKDNNISTYNIPGVDSLCGYGLLDAGAALQLVDKESRRLSHYGTDAFTSNKAQSLYSIDDTITIPNPERYQNEAGDWFLPGKYVVRTYKVDATVFHNLSITDSIVAYWSRHSSSNLLPLYDTNKILLPRERIIIDSLNQSSASLTGYLYSVKDTLGNPLGWWPFDTTLAQAQFAYTILHHDTAFEDTTISNIKEDMSTMPWASFYPNPANQQQVLIINADKSLDLRISLFDIMGKKIKEVYHGKSIIGHNVIASDVSTLSEAMYLYEVKLGNEVIHMRFVKH